ncbi:MAG: hypothetical protein B6I18_02205 [Bacteroidetes bacterium 4572_112]|nr:MAG: hypothetical protein B6I18_02205 [Bacteroidetes bacterium 4572_112]
MGKAVVKSKKNKAKHKVQASKGNSRLKRILFYVFSIIAIAVTSLYLYGVYNFEDIIKQRITELYSASVVSKYYSLEYEKVRIGLFSSNLKIYNVNFIPKIKNQESYFTKNGSIAVKLKSIKLKDFDIGEFLVSNKITVGKILFNKVDVNLTKNAKVFHPFAFIEKKENNDSLKIEVNIGEFKLQGASFSVVDIKNTKNATLFDELDVDLSSLAFTKNEKGFELILKKLEIALYNISHKAENGADISFELLHILTSDIELTKDDNGLTYSNSNNSIELKNPRVITADKVYAISVKSIYYDEIKNELKVSQSTIKPLISKKEFIAKYKYQKPMYDIEIDDIRVDDIDIEKLKKLEGVFANHVDINAVKVHFFKDKHKPLNPKNIPKYLAQNIFGIKIPINIKSVNANNVDVFVEIVQQDSKHSKIDVNDLSVSLKNIQNKSKKQKLSLFAKGKIHNEIPFKLDLVFSYSKNYFSFNGELFSSNLKKIAKPIASFAPVRVNNGQINSVKFKGIANRTKSEGEMTFLYDNLNVEIDRVEKYNTKVSDHLLSIIANSVINSSNPIKPGLPARKVDFVFHRDMNKGFINLLIKSVLTGTKESVLPSKGNRKKYRLEKKRNHH